jgi:hypothetical protein
LFHHTLLYSIKKKRQKGGGKGKGRIMKENDEK